MNSAPATWTPSGLDAAAHHALVRGLAGSELWSLLLGVTEQRAAAVTPGRLMRQWAQDRFVQPAATDQRLLNAVDAELLAASSAFEAVELSPLAPLGACSAVAKTSQKRTVSTMRGTEVVSDPTNVLALECARRLTAEPAATVRLATCQRVVRAQPVPPGPGYAAHFRIFCLATAGAQQADQGFTVAALAEHIGIQLAALNRLERAGFAFGHRVLRLWATPACEPLAQRVQAAVTGDVTGTVTGAVTGAMTGLTVEHAGPPATYYAGLRFMIDVHTAAGQRVPLIDGGVFDWLHKLMSNRKQVFVASGLGAQLAAQLFKAPAAP